MNVRSVDLNKIDFATRRQLVRMPLDKEKKQDFEDVVPAAKY
jgi:hypothetical protein